MSDNLTQALEHAARGWHVFPCREKPGKPYTNNRGELVTPEAKTPYWQKGNLEHGKDNATTDPATIRAWWKRWPDALIGIYCEKSGFFAVDIDNKNGKDGSRAWAQLVETYGGGQDVIPGPVQRTPGKGLHALFRLPPDGLKIPNNADQLAPGLDLRSNGYICTGGAYIWLPGHGPDAQLTQAPAWLLNLIRNMAPKAAEPKEPRAQTNYTPAPDAGAYWLRYYLQRATPGNRNHHGFDLACQLRDSGLTEAQAEAILQAYAAGVPGNGYTESEALDSLESAYRGARREPAHLPGLAMSKNGNGYHPAAEPEQPPTRDSFDEQQEDISGAPGSTWADIAKFIGPITWAWDKWLANGMLHIVASEPGKGKSALCLRLAACYLMGKPWPDGQPFTGELGKVLWCEAEAGQAVNLQRAGDWGLPLDNLLNPLSDPLADLKLDNENHLKALETQARREDVKLIILDSLRGLHSRDENSSETMELVHWLAGLARDTGKPIILTHHLRKRGLFDLGEAPNLDRLRGSTAITQSARLVWAMDTPDPMQEQVARLSVIKSNLARFPQPVGMTIDENGVRFTHAPEVPKTESVADRAADLLLALLSDEPLPATDIEKEIDGAGISMVSAKRAKARLGIVSIKREDGRWYWSLPAKGEYNDYVS